MKTLIEIGQIMQWAEQYAEIAPDRVLLGANEIPEEMRSAVATQLKIRPLLRRKLPHWAECGTYVPGPINIEQCSGADAAQYKERFAQKEDRLMDLTGGLGVDFFTLLSRVNWGVYIEQDQELYVATQYNAPLLGLKDKMHYVLGDSGNALSEYLDRYHPTLIYVDPARRADILEGKRVYAIEDCTPNLYEVLELIYSRSHDLRPRLLVAKVSPMLDVKQMLRSFPRLSEVHIVSVRREVKELLLVFAPQEDQAPFGEEHIPIYAVDLLAYGKELTLRGTYQEEQSIPAQYAEQLGSYIYEPNGAIMKSGLFRLLGDQYGCLALHPDSHLYTSNELIESFPGRAFRVEEVIPFSSSLIKKIRQTYPAAQISCRNFPLRPEALRSKLKIKDKEGVTIIGTTLRGGEEVLLICYLCA